jgi:hypothetical protein
MEAGVQELIREFRNSFRKALSGLRIKNKKKAAGEHFREILRLLPLEK